MVKVNPNSKVIKFGKHSMRLNPDTHEKMQEYKKKFFEDKPPHYRLLRVTDEFIIAKAISDVLDNEENKKEFECLIEEYKKSKMTVSEFMKVRVRLIEGGYNG